MSPSPNALKRKQASIYWSLSLICVVVYMVLLTLVLLPIFSLLLEGPEIGEILIIALISAFYIVSYTSSFLELLLVIIWRALSPDNSHFIRQGFDKILKFEISFSRFLHYRDCFFEFRIFWQSRRLSRRSDDYLLSHFPMLSYFPRQNNSADYWINVS